MWRFNNPSALRERKHLRNLVNDFTKTHNKRSNTLTTATSKRFQHDLAFQLDYYMSPQFAGVASALLNDSYRGKGIDIRFLPTCPVGLEQERVRQHQNGNPGAVTMGSVEQNIFIPTLARDPQLKTTAVAAMFHQSPLCIASLPGKEADGSGSSQMMKIGVHEDTVELMRRVFPQHEVVASARATKNTDLVSGAFDAIQAYTTTEVPALRLGLDTDPKVTPLEGLNGTRLGYGQVLFTGDECLDGDMREVVRAFCEATFEGWKYAIHHPEEAMEHVKEAKKMLGLDDESNDHWHPSDEFELEMLGRCNDLVKGTFEGDRHGVINGLRWDEATKWLLENEGVESGFGLDKDLWQPPKNLLSGNSLARAILDDARTSALNFKETFGREPSLAVITVGTLQRYTHGDRRLQIYSNKSSSWFSKSSTGKENGFDVKEINLDASTTTDELLSCLYSLSDVDAFQLMWPLPPHIDSAKVYSAIDPAKDVDGIHYVGQMEIGNKDAYPPVTPAATMALIEKFNVEVEDKKVLVIGRSPIVGSPIAQMLREKGAAVTVVHSQVSPSKLEKLVSEADVIVSCAGSPGLVKAEWINGAEVINVGTTFDEEKDSLVSDVSGEISKYASRFSPVPGGIGPISAPMLFKNVAKAAWDQKFSSKTVLDNGWERLPSTLRKTYHFESYTAALDAAKRLDEMSTVMDHHANMNFTHKCVNGADLELEFFTYEANGLTDKDYEAAQAVEMLLSKDKTQMSKYSYNLDEKSIALYPASPRGTSKLLRVDCNGEVKKFGNFSEVFHTLAEGCHIVFNDSRVLDARLFVKQGLGKKELMLLDLGVVDVTGECSKTPLQAMIRSENVEVGDTFTECNSEVTIKVVNVKGVWHEDEKSDGNGTECHVIIQSCDSVEKFLNDRGSVPIPPYLHRAAEESDKEAYNNAYANNAGSVAAPTAGLHFTDQVLNEIGATNCSYLSLHVGAGTFKPVMAADARDHEMHSETFTVPVHELKNIIAALKDDKPLIAVGTTSTRTLESLYWCGVKRLRGLETESEMLNLGQLEWVPLQVGESRNISREAAFEALIENKDESDILHGKTSLMICPPIYSFKVVDHLVTNFHAPDSTLMLLVSAFLKDDEGKKISRIYEDAQKSGYRFLSYGDVCMFSRPGR